MLSSALLILPVAAVAAFFCYLPYLVTLWVQKRRLPFARHAALYLLVGTFVMLAYATILWYGLPLNFAPEYHLLNLVPFAWVFEPYAMGTARMVEQLLLNIAMFVPIGLLLPVASEKLRCFPRTALACLGITLAVETLQYFTGRSADIDDVLLNALGGMAGFGLYALLRHTCGQRRWYRLCCGLTEGPAGDGAEVQPPAVSTDQCSTANAN